MADYAQFISRLKKDYNNAKVVVTGGSYGGMLAAWMKIKFPHLIEGAWAASAPLLQLQNAYYDLAGMNDMISKDYRDVHPDCFTFTKKAMENI